MKLIRIKAHDAENVETEATRGSGDDRPGFTFTPRALSLKRGLLYKLPPEEIDGDRCLLHRRRQTQNPTHAGSATVDVMTHRTTKHAGISR